MILITGSVRPRPDAMDDALRLSVEHCRRSRAEPGCLAHHVHRDVEDEGRLVFVEQWADMAAVRTHFAVPESGAFVRALGALAAEPPTLSLYDATETRPPAPAR